MEADHSDDEFQRISDADQAKIAEKMEKVSKTLCVYSVSSKRRSCQRNRIGSVSIDDIWVNGLTKVKRCEK